MAAEKTANKQRGKPFVPGKSGNPNGRPRGARNKTTMAVETLLDGDAEIITRKAVELAKAGDLTALRLCLDRIFPVRRDKPVTFALRTIESPEEAANAMADVLAAVATGELTPMEAAEISKLVDVYVRSVETNELSKRLDRLEKAGT